MARVSGGAAGFRLTEDTISPNLAKLGPWANKVCFATLRYHEGRAESYAKLNAPWTDQTTNARNGLTAKSGRTGKTHWLVLAHRVPYGIYLETRWAGRYAIIMPTLIDEIGPSVMQTLQGILDRFPAGGGR